MLKEMEVEEPFLEQAAHGVFANFKTLRDTMHQTAPLRVRYSGGAEILGFQKQRHTWAVENSGGFVEVVNKRLELLGVLYRHRPWKEWVWEQAPEIIISLG